MLTPNQALQRTHPLRGCSLARCARSAPLSAGVRRPHDTVISQADLYRASDSDPDTIVTFLSWLIAAEGLPSTAHVADIGAGLGRLIAPLAGLGWSVTAYEPDPDYFPAAAAAARNRPNVMVRQGGFEDLSEVGTFHLACGINSSYAHILSPSQRTAALSRMARALRPGGLLVLDLPNFPWILAHYRAPVPQERHWEGRRIVRYREHLIDRERGTFTTVDRDEVSGSGAEPITSIKAHVYAIVSHEMHVSELAAVGFTNVRLFPNFEARAPVPVPGPRLIYVAKGRPPNKRLKLAARVD
jgi:SAM-dependent methyltransferase